MLCVCIIWCNEEALCLLITISFSCKRSRPLLIDSVFFRSTNRACTIKPKSWRLKLKRRGEHTYTDTHKTHKHTQKYVNVQWRWSALKRNCQKKNEKQLQPKRGNICVLLEAKRGTSMSKMIHNTEKSGLYMRIVHTQRECQRQPGKDRVSLNFQRRKYPL